MLRPAHPTSSVSVRAATLAASLTCLCLPLDHPAFAQSGTLVVVNKAANAANLIDIASGRIVTTLPTGEGPHEVAITRDGRTAVVTDYAGGNSLTVIDVARRAVARTVDLARYARPHGIAFLPGDSLVAVTSEASQNVVLVRVTDGQVVRAISTDQGGSHMLAIVGDGTRLYTSNIQDNSVSALDLDAGRRTRTFEVPTQPEAITVTLDGSEVWVGSNAEGTVNVLDTEGGNVRSVLDGLEWPYRILITPDNRHALIPDLRGNRLHFVERASGRHLGVLDFPGAGPQGITLSGDGKTIYLSLNLEDRLAIIDLERRVVTGYIATGARPDGVAYSSIVLADAR